MGWQHDPSPLHLFGFIQAIDPSLARATCRDGYRRGTGQELTVARLGAVPCETLILKHASMPRIDKPPLTMSALRHLYTVFKISAGLLTAAVLRTHSREAILFKVIEWRHQITRAAPRAV